VPSTATPGREHHHKGDNGTQNGQALQAVGIFVGHLNRWGVERPV
jgi:hypothetical protein